ncbi:hypothetical protein IF2G_06263 [Cordyceps javanica]|nr:hypothetical protein IF2G_06263 [Cordyceps javanica]
MVRTRVDGASRASTNPLESTAPRTKLSGWRQTGTRLSGQDTCRVQLWISVRDEKRSRIWDKCLACQSALAPVPPFYAIPSAGHACPPNRLLVLALVLGRSCQCRSGEACPRKPPTSFSTMRASGQRSRQCASWTNHRVSGRRTKPQWPVTTWATVTEHL